MAGQLRGGTSQLTSYLPHAPLRLGGRQRVTCLVRGVIGRKGGSSPLRSRDPWADDPLIPQLAPMVEGIGRGWHAREGGSRGGSGNPPQQQGPWPNDYLAPAWTSADHSTSLIPGPLALGEPGVWSWHWHLALAPRSGCSVI